MTSNDLQTSNSLQSKLPVLSYIRDISILALPDRDLGFFERLLRVSPNASQLSVYFDDLSEIVQTAQQNLLQILQQHIYQLKINFDYPCLISDIRRDIPKILRVFSRINVLTISLHEGQRRTLLTVKELLTYVFKHQSDLRCINIKSHSATAFDAMKKQGDIDLIKIWLRNTGNTRFKYENYLKDFVRIELNSSSLVVWL